ncbi:hypothetical protein [Microbacterium oxydans]|uniref:hypothetical protein n=1 Tax=Microbacterium oxydans TaxID=82380 RepID=UPI0024ACF2A8|nr:hypothetical protein [Microbacterium oxydans]
MDGFAAVDFGFALKVLQRVDPFEGEPPRWVRAVSYRYRFATRAESGAVADCRESSALAASPAEHSTPVA